MSLSDRDKFLMREAFKCGKAGGYTDLESWLIETIDDVGHTVEQHIAHDADSLIKELKG